MKKVKSFFMKMLTPNSGVSSSRFYSLIALSGLISMIVGNWLGKTFQEALIYSLAGIVVGVTSAIFIEKIKNKNHEDN